MFLDIHRDCLTFFICKARKCKIQSKLICFLLIKLLIYKWFYIFSLFFYSLSYDHLIDEECVFVETNKDVLLDLSDVKAQHMLTDKNWPGVGIFMCIVFNIFIFVILMGLLIWNKMIQWVMSIKVI